MAYDLALGWQGNFDKLYQENEARQQENNQTDSRLSNVVGYTESASEQFRSALQFYLSTLPDTDIKNFEKVIPTWELTYNYKAGYRVTYGINTVNDPQIYRCILEHVSTVETAPDVDTTHWVAVAITPAGYPEWSQPAGAHDAYNKDDIVSHNEKLWKSVNDGNMWEPSEAVPELWTVYNTEE